MTINEIFEACKADGIRWASFTDYASGLRCWIGEIDHCPMFMFNDTNEVISHSVDGDCVEIEVILSIFTVDAMARVGWTDWNPYWA